MGTPVSIHGRLFQIDSETGQILVLSESNNGAKNGATVTCKEYGNQILHRTVLTLAATPITFADDAGVAQYGGVKIYDFPAGDIVTLGCSVTGALTLPAPFIDAWTGVFALGTVTATTGSTLVSTEATFLQSVSISAATAKVGTLSGASVATQLTESGARWVDGTSSPADMFLNVAVADNAAHTAETGTFTGTVSFIWLFNGDR